MGPSSWPVKGLWRCSLPGIATILTAELMSIKLALNYVAELEPGKYLLCTVLLNSMICIENRIVKTIVQIIQELCHREIEREERSLCCGYLVIWAFAIMTWQIKQLRIVLDVHKSLLQYLIETGSLISREGCMSSGRRVGERTGETYLLKPKTWYWTEDTRKRTRRDEVVINRLRLGHTRLTHGFMFDPELQRVRPPCELCNEFVVSIQHILIECSAIAAQRRQYLQSSYEGRRLKNVLNLLGEGGPIRGVLCFLREVNLYDKILKISGELSFVWW